MANKVNSIYYRKQILFLSLITIALAMVFKLLNGIIDDSKSLLYIFSIETTVIMIWVVLLLRKMMGTFFKITIIFVVMFSLYMFGQVFLNTIGALNEPILRGNITEKGCIDAIVDVQIYLSFFLIGVCLARKLPVTSAYSYDNHAIKVGYWILAFSLPFEVAIAILKITLSLTMGYASLYQDVAYEMIPSYMKILSYFFLSGVFYLLFASQNNSKHEKFAIFLLALHSISYLVMGYRSACIAPLLLLVYALKIKRPNMDTKKSKRGMAILFLVLIALVLVVFPYVGKNRNNGENAETTESVSDIITENGLFTTVGTMGQSLQVVAYTRELVPSEYPYRYGYTYLINLTTILPNLFWDRHPAEVYGSLGRWLTKIVDYEFYEFGGGLGYSCVAEAYINFGYLGLIFIALLFGYCLMTIENKIDAKQKPILFASMAIVAIYLVSYARGEFDDIVRAFFWYMLIPRILYNVTKKKYKHEVRCSNTN